MPSPEEAAFRESERQAYEREQRANGRLADQGDSLMKNRCPRCGELFAERGDGEPATVHRMDSQWCEKQLCSECAEAVDPTCHLCSEAIERLDDLAFWDHSGVLELAHVWCVMAKRKESDRK